MQVNRFPFTATTLAIAMAATLGLAACDRAQDDRSLGQKTDSAVAKVEQKTNQAAAEVKKDAAAVRESTTKAMDSAASKIKDATITTSIKTELAKDSSLSALKINVDTDGGRVSLRGTAPDAAAREHATQLAQHVDGVVSVENQLTISK